MCVACSCCITLCYFSELISISFRLVQCTQESVSICLSIYCTQTTTIYVMRYRSTTIYRSEVTQKQNERDYKKACMCAAKFFNIVVVVVVAVNRRGCQRQFSLVLFSSSSFSTKWKHATLHFVEKHTTPVIAWDTRKVISLLFISTAKKKDLFHYCVLF